MSDKRILVLGTSGRVGRLVRMAWDRQPPQAQLILQSRHGPGVHWQPGQPNPFGMVDAVIALWGVTPGRNADLSQNTALALAAQQIAQDCGAGRVLHCSSIAVYAPKVGPLTETDPTGDVNPYGSAKRKMEHALATAPGPARTVLRIGSVAGAESLAAAIRQGWSDTPQPVTLDRFADGKGPARSYIAPSDLARVLVQLAGHPGPLPEVLNVGAPAPVHMESLLGAAQHPFVWQEAPPTARQYATMDCTKLAELTGLDMSAADPAHIMHDWLSLEGRP